MACCAVVDANSISEFQQERIAGKPGEAVKAIKHIFTHGHIIMDARKLIQQEWVETASGSAVGQNLLDWIADQILKKKIKIISVPADAAIAKIIKDFGMPKKDHVYVKTAIAAPAKMIVTDDIDFHDPALKKAKGPKKDQVKAQKCGTLCKFLYKKHGIFVGTLSEVEGVLP